VEAEQNYDDGHQIKVSSPVFVVFIWHCSFLN
jgi:hypothetical protein